MDSLPPRRVLVCSLSVCCADQEAHPGGGLGKRGRAEGHREGDPRQGHRGGAWPFVVSGCVSLLPWAVQRTATASREEPRLLCVATMCVRVMFAGGGGRQGLHAPHGHPVRGHLLPGACLPSVSLFQFDSEPAKDCLVIARCYFCGQTSLSFHVTRCRRSPSSSAAPPLTPACTSKAAPSGCCPCAELMHTSGVPFSLGEDAPLARSCHCRSFSRIYFFIEIL